MVSALMNHRSFRRTLALSTALGGFLVVPVAAQTVTLPNQNSVQDVNVSLLGSGPKLSLSNNDTRLNVNLRAATTVIDWRGFNIPEDHTINFSNGRIVSGGAAVLNRDVSANPSQLLGNLTSARDVSVWVMNANGILVGSGANFSTGSLVLSTLDITPSDFINAGSDFRLRSPVGKEGSAITVANGATFTVDGQTRGLVMVAPKIDAHGEFIARGQDVAFVSATDVTLGYRSGSPLSVTINRGSPVAGTGQLIQGKVEGNNALFALATAEAITDSLLKVSAEVTTASAGSRGIVLSAGRTSDVPGVTLSDDTATTGASVGVAVEGLLRTEGTNGRVAIGATGAVTVNGAVSTNTDVSIAAGGALNISGQIGAADDVRLSGNGIAFGGTTSTAIDPTTVRAGDQVSLISVDGSISAIGPLTLQSGATGDDGLLIETRGTIGGDILLGAESRLVAGGDRNGGVTVRLRDATNAVTLGDVSARTLRSAVGTGVTGNGLQSKAAVSLGDVNLREALVIEAGELKGGTLTSNRAIDLRSSGTISVGGLDARGGSATARATGAIAVTGAVRAAGGQSDAVFDTTASISLAGISAGRDIIVGGSSVAGDVAITGDVAAGRSYQIDTNRVTLGGAEPVTQIAGSGVRITSGEGGIIGLNGLTLGADASGGTTGMTLAIDPARTTGGGGGAIDFADGSRLFGGPARDSDVRIRSADAAGIVRLGEVSARGLLGASGTADFASGLTRTSALETGRIALRQDLRLSGSTITTGDLSTNGAIVLSSPGAITTAALAAGTTVDGNALGTFAVNGDVTANQDVALTGSTITFAGAALRSGGSIDVLARSGSITGVVPLAITSTSSDPTDFIRLGAAGPGGITLAEGSTITGGVDRNIGVRIFTAAEAPLALGDVTARSLGTIDGIDADPLGAPGAFRSQGSLSFGRLNLIQGFTAESTAGNLTVSAIAVAGADQGIDLRAGAGTLFVQTDMNASGAITLVSGSDLTIGTVESRNATATVRSGGVLSAGTLRGRIGVVANGTSLAVGVVNGGEGAVDLTATNGMVTAGDVTGTQGVAVSGMTLSLANVSAAGGAVALSALTGDVSADDLTGAQGVTANGAALRLGNVEAASGTVTLNARSGSISSGNLIGAQGVTVSAAALSLGNVDAAFGAVALAGGTGATSAGTLNGALGVTASGAALLLGNVDGAADAVSLAATAGDLTTGGVQGGRVTLSARGGAIDVAGALSARNGAIDVRAAGAINANAGITSVGGGVLLASSGGKTSTTGGIQSAGDVSLSGTSITLGAINQAQGGYVASASAGGIDLAGDGGSIRANGGGSGDRGIILSANGGAIALGETRLFAGLGSVALGTDGDGITVGAVEAGSLTATGAANTGAAIQTGNLNVNTDLSLSANGAVRTGAINVLDGDVILTSGASDVATGAIIASGTALLTGTGLELGNVEAAGLTATATNGGIVGGTITTAGNVALKAARSVNSGMVTSTAGDVAITGAGPLTIGGVDAGGTATIISSASDLDVVVTNGVRSVNAATVRSGGDIRTPFVISSAGDLVVAAPQGRVAGLAPGSGTDLAAGPGGAFWLTVGTDAELGTITGGNISITATSITADSIAGGSQAVTLRATAGDLIVLGPVVGADISLTSIRDTRLGTIDASGAVTIGGERSLDVGTVSGASIGVTGGTVSGTALRTPGAIGIDAAALTLNTAEAETLAVNVTDGLAVNAITTTGDTTLTAGGAILLATAKAGSTLALDAGAGLTFDRLAGNAVTVGGVAIRGNAVDANSSVTIAGTTIDLGAVNAGSLVSDAADALSFDTVVTRGDATMSAGRTVAFNTISAGGSISVGGGTIGGDAMNAGGSVKLRGAAIAMSRVDAGMLTAETADALSIGSVIARGDATLTAGGAMSVDSVSTTGALSIDAIAGATFDRLAANAVTIVGGTIRGTSITADAAVTMRGAALNLGTVDSGADFTGTGSGAVMVGAITTGGDAVVSSDSAATIGNVSAARAYRVTGSAVTLGGVQQATGDVRIVATGGAVQGTGLSLTSGAAMVLDGAGGVNLGGTAVRAGGALGLRAGRGNAIRLGSVEAASIGGFDGTTITDRLTHEGSLEAGDVNAGSIAVTLNVGDLAFERVTARGAVSLVAAGSVRTGDLEAARLDAKAGTGLTLGTTTVSDTAILAGTSIETPQVTAGALTITTAGAISGVGAGTDGERAALRTTAGDIVLDANTARLGDVESAGAATLRVGAIDAAGRLAAARQLLIEARSALTLGEASAGADLTLKATDAVRTGALTAAGTLKVEGSAITLGSGTATAGIALDAAGTVRAGALTGGPSVTIRGADAELSGAVRGTSVQFATRDPANTALRIGNGTIGDGFRLSANEIGLVTADALQFDSGSGAMEIGTLALTPTNATSIVMLSTGDVLVSGQLASSGGAQAIRIGGDAGDGQAQTLHVVATSDAGGRLYVESADLELRANRIAVGLAPGFVDTLQPGETGIAQAAALIGNANSALYNPLLGGAAYAPDATTTLAARSLTVRFGDYALFQNSAIPGQNSGVTLGSAATPALPALRVSSSAPPASSSFAFFGTINGISGASTALLGDPVIQIDPTLLANSRINGCLARSGAGCLTTIVIQPTLQVFNWNSEAVFGIRQDVSLPFSPIIGANNEELLSGLPALAPEELGNTPPVPDQLQEPRP